VAAEGQDKTTPLSHWLTLSCGQADPPSFRLAFAYAAEIAAVVTSAIERGAGESEKASDTVLE
jgi:hypothetical protein